MRTYGRVTDSDGSKSWVVVTTSPNGSNDEVNLTTLCQVLLLNLNESPFFANSGIPAHASINQQIPPDFYVAAVQRQFAPLFASLAIKRVLGAKNPTYGVFVMTNQGAQLTAQVAK